MKKYYAFIKEGKFHLSETEESNTKNIIIKAESYNEARMQAFELLKELL